MTKQQKLWLEYCAAVKEHHAKQTHKTLITAINKHDVWRKEFLRGGENGK